MDERIFERVCGCVFLGEETNESEGDGGGFRPRLKGGERESKTCWRSFLVHDLRVEIKSGTIHVP